MDGIEHASTFLCIGLRAADHPEEMRAPALKTAIAVLAACAAAALAGSTFSAFSSASSNSGSTFATAASFDTCPNTTVSFGLTSGFESGRAAFSVDGLFPAGSGLSFDSTVKRTGGYSLRVAAAGAAGYVSFWWPAPQPATAVVRFAIRLNSLPAGNVTQLFSTLAGGGATAQLRYVAASQKLAIALTGATGGTPSVATANTTVSAGTWYVIEIRHAVGTTTHAVDWQLDGQSQPGTTVAGGATVTTQNMFGTNTSDTFTAHYDDILISDNGTEYPQGDGRVFPLSPNAMGAHSNAAAFQDDDGSALDATSWQRLDEIPTNSITDWIQFVTGGASNYAEILFGDTTETCIRAVQATMATHSASTSQQNGARTSVFDGSTETLLKAGTTANAVGSRDYSKLVTPASSWSQAAVNGLVGRFGFAADVSPTPMLDGLLLEYEVPQ
jgi:hypothetical protein